MQQTNKRPGAASPARRASVLKPQGNKAQHKARAGRRQPATFADWCQTDGVNQLGLEPDAVARICRVTSRPEMGGISTLDGLIKSLSWLRKPFYHDDDFSWQRFTLTARFLWLVF
jgi:hypothetical protein